MTLALKDTDGKLRSFSDFQKEVDKMNLQYNGNWLRTEYNHAVAASQCAARWTEQVSRSQSMPYLQYQAVMDKNTRPEHAALNGVIKRIDSDFWDKYYPPNGWGCRCEVIQLPGKNHKETPDMDLKHCKVAPMFQVNVGKKGVIFPKDHPYFMSQCQRCNGTPKQLAINPQCAACVAAMEDCKARIQEQQIEHLKGINPHHEKPKFRLAQKTMLSILKQNGTISYNDDRYYTKHLYFGSHDMEMIKTHCHNAFEVEAAEHIHAMLKNIKKGKFRALDMNRRNYKRKIADGVIYFVDYEIEYKGRPFILSCEAIKNDNQYFVQEHPYSFKEKTLVSTAKRKGTLSLAGNASRVAK